MSIERLTDTLKQNNLRVTQARKMIYSLLGASKVSLSVKEVYKEMSSGGASTDLASVYRNLQLFSELGLTHRFQDGRFANCHQEETSDQDTCGHIHIISHCKSCGASHEIESHSKGVCQLVEELKSLGSALDNFKEIVIQGECSKCAVC